MEALGPGTDTFSPGDAVYARGGVYRDGTYGEFALVQTSEVAPKPAQLDHIHAAALPHVTLTAWAALFDLADLQPGQTVLVHGAAGGVGHIAVQLAKWCRARVIGTASVNFDFLETLGVDQAIDYSQTAFEDAVQDVDVVLDTIGADTQARSWSILKRGGILVSTVEAPSEDTAAQHGVRGAMVFSSPPVAETLKKLAGMVSDGSIQPTVSEVLPLQEVKKAHQIVEQKHTRGKIVLQVD